MMWHPQVILGLLQMGFIVTFLSDSVVSGFTTGAALLIMSSQVTRRAACLASAASAS